MSTNFNTPVVEYLENGNYHVYRKLFPAKQHFLKWDHRARKFQESGSKQNKMKKINRTLKLCTLATNNLILS